MTCSTHPSEGSNTFTLDPEYTKSTIPLAVTPLLEGVLLRWSIREIKAFAFLAAYVCKKYFEVSVR